MRGLFTRWKIRAAREAIIRCYSVPYLNEISSREHHGMLELERRGMVVRDEGLGGRLHWHLTAAGRRWLAPSGSERTHGGTR